MGMFINEVIWYLILLYKKEKFLVNFTGLGLI